MYIGTTWFYTLMQKVGFTRISFYHKSFWYVNKDVFIFCCFFGSFHVFFDISEFCNINSSSNLLNNNDNKTYMHKCIKLISRFFFSLLLAKSAKYMFELRKRIVFFVKSILLKAGNQFRLISEGQKLPFWVPF